MLAETDTLLSYLKVQLDRLRRDGFNTLNDVWVGLNNRVTKETGRMERELWGVRGEIEELKRRIAELEGKEGSGRGVSVFGERAPLTLRYPQEVYEAA